MGMGMGETGMVDEGWALGGLRVGRGLGDGGARGDRDLGVAF